MPLANVDDILPSSDLPSLSMVYMLDAVIAKIQVTLDDLFTKSMVSGCVVVLLRLKPVYTGD